MNNEYGNKFAKVYDFEGQNNFSLNLFNNFFKYCEEKAITFNNHLDVACGTGAFCFEMHNKDIKTEGIDISEGMISVARINKGNRDINFNVANMVTYGSENKKDLITCNYDAINHLLTFDEWKCFLKETYNNLNENGYFLFDFNTFNKFSKFNMSSYSTRNKDFDSFFSVFPINDYQVVFRFIYYILEENGLYSKVEQSVLESFFETKNIINTLKELDFKNIILFDDKFNECEINSNSERLYVFCQK